VCNAATLQFIKGIDEPSVPDVKLTRSKDGSSGTATFVFSTPSVFESSEELGDITGLFMIDDEGEFSTVDVQAKFVNGKPDALNRHRTDHSLECTACTDGHLLGVLSVQTCSPER